MFDATVDDGDGDGGAVVVAAVDGVDGIDDMEEEEEEQEEEEEEEKEEKGGNDGEEEGGSDGEEEDCDCVVPGWLDRIDSAMSLDDKFEEKVEEESMSEEKKEIEQTQSRISSLSFVYI